jgi:hypothetical protein
MPIAWLTRAQIFVFVGLLVVLGLLAFPPTRKLTQASLRNTRSLIASLMLCVLLVISGIAIYGDLQYWLDGEEATATITKVEPRGKSRRVDYRFVDADGVTPTDGRVVIQYLPGDEPRSRLSRAIVHWLPYTLFGVSLGLLVLTFTRGAWRVMRAA